MAQPVSSMSLGATHHESVVPRLADHVGMPFVAKSAAPNAPHETLRHPTLDHAAMGTLTLFNAPTGDLLADNLAATLAEHGRPILWLRLGHEDSDPATFLVTLIAAQRLYPEIRAATFEQMRRHPLARSAGGRSCLPNWHANWKPRCRYPVHWYLSTATTSTTRTQRWNCCVSMCCPHFRQLYLYSDDARGYSAHQLAAANGAARHR
jgi:hypothetical protein